MTQPQENGSQGTSRREFLKTSSKLVAAGALAGVSLPHVHAQGSDVIRVALVGCGGRGGGAAGNALSVKKGSVKLAAMADVFADKQNNCLRTLKGQEGIKDDVDVTDDTKFLGFDAYKKAMDVLKPGDIAIFTTPLAFRWVNFQYAIEKGLNVFMEKPLTADGPTSRRMIKLAEEADKKKLKCGVGLMSRHARNLQELHKRIEDGQLGDIVLMRGYRMHGPVGSMASLPKPKEMTEVEYQIRRFHSFLWASGGCYSDFYIHHIDHLCWMKNSWPVKAQGIGGRHYKKSPDGVDYVDQNFDSYSVEYTFADGGKMYLDGRCMVGTKPFYHSWVHGTKGCAIASKNGDCGDPSAIYSGQAFEPSKRVWQSDIPPAERDPYLNEWVTLIDAIRNDKPHNEVKRGVEASIVTSMGRMAAHTGQEITFDEMLNHEHEYAPNVDKMTFDGPAPLTSDANGRYPQPQPGQLRNREYGEAAA